MADAADDEALETTFIPGVGAAAAAAAGQQQLLRHPDATVGRNNDKLVLDVSSDGGQGQKLCSSDSGDSAVSAAETTAAGAGEGGGKRLEGFGKGRAGIGYNSSQWGQFDKTTLLQKAANQTEPAT